LDLERPLVAKYHYQSLTIKHQSISKKKKKKKKKVTRAGWRREVIGDQRSLLARQQRVGFDQKRKLWFI
jgi:hypothetical protein